MRLQHSALRFWLSLDLPSGVGMLQCTVEAPLLLVVHYGHDVGGACRVLRGSCILQECVQFVRC